MVSCTTVFPLTGARIDGIAHLFVKYIPSGVPAVFQILFCSLRIHSNIPAQGQRQHTASIVNQLYSIIKVISAVGKKERADYWGLGFTRVMGKGLQT